MIERSELLSAVWGDAFVTDHVLNRSIGQLRKVLGDDVKEPRYIETVPTLGYRFIAEVETDAPATPPPVALQPSSWADPIMAAQPVPVADKEVSVERSPGNLLPAVQRKLGSPAVATAVLFLFVLAIAAARMAVRRFQLFGVVPIRSLAVIPLENLSGDPVQDYLADGMTDQLITNLGQIGALRVISQTTASQYKRAHKPLPQIAKELNVDAVVEGSVFRSGDQLRISAQLVNATTEKQLWSHTYDGELRNVLGLENQVAGAVAEQIRVKLTQSEQTRLADRQEVDPQAYEALLKGNYFFEQNTEATTKKALQYFQKALHLDPKFARAYVGIARSYNFLGDGIVPSGEAAAAADAAVANALQLQPDLAAAYAERGWTLLYYHWDFPGAERDFRHALELDPGLMDAHEGYGNYLVVTGRFEEGLQEMKRARDLAPLSPIVITDYCNLLYETRRYNEAQTQCAAALELDPNYGWALDTMVGVDYALKDYPQAHAAMAKILDMNGQTDAATFAMFKEIHEAPSGVGVFDAWLKTQKDPDPFFVASEYAWLGRRDEALAWLEKNPREQGQSTCDDPSKRIP